MSLLILGVDVRQLERVANPTVPRYRHLNCIGGVASVPPSLPALKAAGYQPNNAGGSAAGTLGEAAEASALRVLASLPESVADDILQQLHCQATLSEQILESICLRVATSCLKKVERALALDQIGTAGVATALQLAALFAERTGRSTLITAADAWRAPFCGDFSPLLRYADAAAAMVVASERSQQPALGRIEAVACRHLTQRGPFWQRAPQTVAAALASEVVAAAGQALKQAGWTSEQVDLVIGEPIGCGVPTEVAAQCGWGAVQREPVEVEHLSSAALMASIQQAVSLAGERDRPLECLAWCASPEGHVAALALTAYPRPVADG